MAKKFYLTCAIPYVNAAPHIGHALEFVQGDVIARYHALLGEETRLLSGGDENALKNVQAAEKAGVPIQQFVDDNTQKFLDLTKALGCRFDVWQKGSDQVHHFPASQKLWKLCAKAGDIYQKSYEGLYCVGCETFYEPSELNENGECFEHPGKKLENVSENNYFFRLSKYQSQLVELITKDQLRVIPDTRKNEVLSFLKQPLQDISISRSNERAKNWGVPVPGDDTQRIYVWFDALNIYQSGIGFGWNEEMYKKWWPADVHVIGKGITRFHAVYWPAFLLSAGLPLPRAIFVHEYFTVNGQKMSKTLGNVIDPVKLIDTYGADPLRYYFLAKFSPFSDGDFSEDEFKKVYNADLANGLGNLVSRTFGLAAQNFGGKIPAPDRDPDAHPLRTDPAIHTWKTAWKDIDASFRSYELNTGIGSVWKFLKDADKYINDQKPWELSKKDPKALAWVLYGLLDSIHQIAWQIYPYLPETALHIARAMGSEKLLLKNPVVKDGWTNIAPGTKLTLGKPLFPRL
ncbi:methionine--tRNA ligase [Patescibacteria group bacterium]|nr:methionine--tRNA ligase [Patescibacteria group bacterium]